MSQVENGIIPIYENFINGQFIATKSHYEVKNPATHALISKVSSSDINDVNHAVEAALAAKKAWARRPAIERAYYLHKIAAAIRLQKSRLANVISREQGKTLNLAEIEVSFTADYLDYMAEWARRIEGEIIPSDRQNETIMLFRKPLGVIAGILPWNFPFFLIARKMAPALITGNTVVIKPSEETPNNCYEFARIVASVGLPAGVFNVVNGTGLVGGNLSEHSDINMVSFTGSVKTGHAIMRAAANNLTKVNLELGGKAPAIVLADADLDLAATAIRNSKIINSGQVCNCVERVYVERKVADEFIDKISSQMSTVRYGDPLSNQSIDMGPLINSSALEKVESMVNRAIQQGATVLTGGQRAQVDQGFHFQPTVLMNCSDHMEIMKDEIFGPVLPIQIVENLDEAISLSNASDYGLTSSIYTQSLSNTMHAIQELDFGETYINRENFEAMQGFHAGVRKSGIGGADGKHGLYEYTHTHVVYLQN